MKMIRFIVLLRGINVSGRNKLPMAALRALLVKMGFLSVQTYIQSGNIVLSSEKDSLTVAKLIKDQIEQTFGYDVLVLVKTIAEWERAIANNPYPVDDEKLLYFTFLNNKPKGTNIDVSGTKDDVFTIVDDVVYLYCKGGYGKTKLSNNLFEKKLNVLATTRNYRTTVTLLELSKNG